MSRVLVVDDDAVLLRTVARELRSAGWEVVTCEWPFPAHHQDVCLCDLEPNYAKQKEHCERAGVPMVVFTGNHEEANRLRAEHVVVVDKPWQSGELDAALRKVCK